MKKLFTLIAAVFMAAGANAQTIASYDAGTKTGTWSIVGTNASSGSLEYSAKYNKNSTEVTTITFPNGATKDGAWSYAVKVEGDFKAGDVITIQPFTTMSTADYTGVPADQPEATPNPTKYANILLYYEKTDGSPKQIADLTGSSATAKTVTDGHEEEGDPKTFTYTLEEDYTNLFFARGGNTRINLMKVTIVRGESGGGGEGGGGETTDESVIASWEAGTQTGTATFAYQGNVAADYSAKYNKSTTTVKTITFPNGFKADKKDETGEVISTDWHYLKLTGEFKAGDVVTIQPFTAMSSSDFTGGAKYANIFLYSAQDADALIADLTGSAAGALTVTDGHEQEGTPKEFTYTLTSDYTDLYFGRNGNTRINVMKLTVTRPTTTAINSVSTVTVKGNGKIYNLAGQQVTASYKGIVIKNGKKMVQK